MGKRDFENEQDMSVEEKQHPALGPTEEAQDVATLPRIVVPVPAYNDPNEPMAAAGSVNMALADHPLPHSEDYGASAVEGVGEDEVQYSLQGEPVDTNRAAARRGAEGLPEDRTEWTNANYKTALQAHGLSTSGNRATLEQRLSEHEAEQEETAAWEEQVRNASREELDKIATSDEFDLNPSDYSTKEDLANAIISASHEE